MEIPEIHLLLLLLLLLLIVKGQIWRAIPDKNTIFTFLILSFRFQYYLFIFKTIFVILVLCL